MTDDDERQTYHHNANEGETRGPAGEDRDPHHALNTPVEAIEEGDRTAVGAEDDEAEILEDADDRAEEQRTSEERSRKD
jgi:hypothetical protein